MPKPDEAHLRTEKELQALERRIAQVYKDAADELTDTIKAYFESFRKRDEDMRKRVEAGEITEDYYKQWRLNQIGRGKRFEALRDQVAERYTKANETAIAYVNDDTPGIYSLNRNYAAYTIEQVAGNVGFTLWDESTVRRLIVEQPDVMPYYPPPRAVKRGIDFAYGKSQITKSVTSSILQGLSVGKMADDLQRRIRDMNRVSAIRAARTATTAAQNAGRMDSYHAAQKMGIKMRKEWLATLDGRTRHAHAMLDGQKVDVDKPFKVEGHEIRYPGDPLAAPYLVYNCRCTLIAAVDDVDTSSANRRAIDPKTGESVLIEDMSYSEWAGWKKAGAPIEHTEAYNNILASVKANKVDYNPVSELKESISDDKIIEKISGGDTTEGSCSSLAFAYIGNKCGLDVTDYRGGSSRFVFSTNATIEQMSKLDGVKSTVVSAKKELAGVTEALKNVEAGKQYYLAAGKHAAIIKGTGSSIEYLELQSTTNSGWHRMTVDTLKRRFGCRKTADTMKIGGQTITFERKMYLMEVDSFRGNQELSEILGYLNTAPEKQKKGAAGSVK